MKSKAIILLICALVTGMFTMISFYSGKMYAVQNTKAYYYSGTVLLELDGNLYNVIMEGNYEWAK
jgi:hypothetical protein